MRRIPRLLAAVWLIGAAAQPAEKAVDAAAPPDPFLWLEDVSGPRALAWVRQQNTRTLGVLQADKHYRPFFDQALAIAQAVDRVPAPQQLGGAITNFWQDQAHPRGVWRRASLDQFKRPSPDWTTILDLDALARREGGNPDFKGATCRLPAEQTCLIALSDGGEDAVTEREFDLSKSAFVPGGFVLPRAKMSADWWDDGHLLVATDWGAGSMTASGYPFIVKRLARGAKLAAAVEIFRGKPGDVGVNVLSTIDGEGHRLSLVVRELDAFHAEYFRVTDQGVTRLNLPQKTILGGLVQNRLVVRIDEDFAPPGGGSIAGGSIVALDLSNPAAPPAVLFAPGQRQSVDEMAVSKTAVIATIYDHVRGRAMVFTPAGAGWTSRTLALPENAAINIVSTTPRDDTAFLNVTGFLTPTSLFLCQLDGSAPPEPVKTSPARFDASKDIVEQFEAVSKDGTKIPYFVVHPKAMRLDGQNPALLTAYGGFGVSELPAYNPITGKLWLERGGVFVLANIRGGGEFGPAWHEAAMKTHRQTAYDDFAAVAEDLITRKITAPRRLGIEGRSNGGLLMGVEFTQHPELWNAVVIGVPLLDMLRFEQIAAGASWTGEYGSVAHPEERAFLAGISPYHHLVAGVKYPEPYIFTTTKDDRVGPVHARKFAAKMEALGLPFFYDESIEGGHAGAVNAAEIAESRALVMTYLTRKLME